MKKFIANVIMKLMIACILVVLLFTQSISFAWLSTAWNGGEFELTAAYTNTPLFELWTYHAKASSAGSAGWYKTYNADTNSDNSLISKEKAIERISVEDYADSTATPGTSTFTPYSGDFSLYFGTINNLVQKQDNIPVYFKFTLKLPSRSKNEIKISYSLPTNYVRPYLVNVATGVGTLIGNTTANGNLYSELNSRNFVEMQYYFDTTANTNYVLASETGSALPVGFDDLFETESTNLHNYGDYGASSTQEYDSITMTNTGNTEKNIYVYFKYSVPTETIQEALLNTKLKANMPMYLIFDAKFNIEVISSAG